MCERSPTRASRSQCVKAAPLVRVIVHPGSSNKFALTLKLPGISSCRRYSTWTEAVWSDGGVRIYLLASPQSDAATLGGGIAFLVVVFALVWFAVRSVSLPLDLTPPVNDVTRAESD